MVAPKPSRRLASKNQKRLRRKTMTICIAAFAAKSRAIVCIADRALTYPGFGTYTETDSGIPKIVDLPGHWCAMFSCDGIAFPKRVLDRVTSHLKSIDTVTRVEIEKSAKQAFNEVWRQEIEDQILKPSLLTIDTYANRPDGMQPLDPALTMKIAKEISEYKQNCSIIFCGYEEALPQMFTVHTPCLVEPNDWEGFSIIGGGTEAARNQLIYQQYDKDDSLQSVLYDVFCAKCATELIQGVGVEWNWKVILPGQKPFALPKKIDDLIDRLWGERTHSPFGPKLSKKEKAPLGWEKTFDEYVDRTLGKKTSPSSPVVSEDQP